MWMKDLEYWILCYEICWGLQGLLYSQTLSDTILEETYLLVFCVLFLSGWLVVFFVCFLCCVWKPGSIREHFIYTCSVPSPQSFPRHLPIIFLGKRIQDSDKFGFWPFKVWKTIDFWPKMVIIHCSKFLPEHHILEILAQFLTCFLQFGGFLFVFSRIQNPSVLKFLISLVNVYIFFSSLLYLCCCLMAWAALHIICSQ